MKKIKIELISILCTLFNIEVYKDDDIVYLYKGIHLEKPADNFEEYKEHPELGLMVLDYIIENNSKRCPKIHNGNTAVYKQYKGAKGYDDLVSLNTPR